VALDTQGAAVIRVNTRAAHGSIDAAMERLDAVTVTIGGRGHVVVGPTGAHGREVLASLRARGRDPLTVTAEQREGVVRTVRRELRRSTRAAALNGRPVRDARRRALLAGGQHLVEMLRRWIIGGGLGANSPGYQQVKAEIQRKSGQIRYGVPSAYGILSGRFIGGIRARWRSGR